MLNGIEPIILFNFFKKTPAIEAAIADIPIVSQLVSKFDLPPIPIYLSEELTGIYIDSEEKSIEVDTKDETLQDGEVPKTDQKGIHNLITVNMVATTGALGITLLSALADLVFQKVTSKEYSITYLSGPTTVFNGLLHGFSVSSNTNSNLMNIRLELSRSRSLLTKAVEATSISVPAVEPPVTLQGG